MSHNEQSNTPEEVAAAAAAELRRELEEITEEVTGPDGKPARIVKPPKSPMEKLGAAIDDLEKKLKGLGVID